MTVPLPEQLKKQDNERLTLYKTHLAFYQGDQWATPRRPRDRRRQLTFNYAKTLVQKITAYVMQGRTVNVEPRADDDAAQTAAAEAEAAIGRVHEENHADRLDYDTEIDTAVLGDGAYKVTWDAERTRVVITAPDVQGIFAWPEAQDLTTSRRVVQRYQVMGDDPLVAEFAPAPDKLVEVIEDWTAAVWELWVNGEVRLSQANPYGFIPYVVFPNESQPKRWWGSSDIEQIRTVAEQLNRHVTRIDNVLELSGNPIAVLEGVTQSEDIAAEPGAVWELPTGTKAYLLDLLKGGGVKLHMDYVELLRNIMEDLAETPKTAFGESERDLSGIALRIQLQPLLQKVDRKRLIRTGAYVRRTEMALELLKQFGGEDHTGAGRLTVNWEAPTPGDRTELIDQEVKLIEAGLAARRSAIARLGDVADVDKELQAIEAETPRAPRPGPGGSERNGARAG